ncbi:MAG: leucyl aminopeptidase [Gammaproteobacteria bacterium]|nr:leucyl aminopeptidase [Gammaproteobacteria bacterium]MBU6510333.1 leucyl aminopeptidase [Gammaproteobacteria bacterium]MDE1984370.1 leucyl aminopeptidase [Gammaproteobacteria bacterium]MDE2108690.1 leucyl aminopeptidase [Gammaproteobacteria bacterium]MDE2461244.1 leucyl aminopeptidase [Gammaproteobacteria bacterium]
MEFSSKSAALPSLACACLVVGVFEDGKLTEPARLLDQASRGHLAKLVKSGAFAGRSGQSLMLFQIPSVSAERVLLIGLGAEKEFNLRVYRKVVDKSVRALLDGGVTEAALTLSMLSVPDADVYARARHAVECAGDAAYRFEQCKSKPDKHQTRLQKLDLLVSGREELRAAERGIGHGSAIAGGVALAKDLGNLPPNICTPGYLANEARKLGRGGKLKITVLEEAQMKKLGMGALLAVSQGSREPAKLIIMEYRGGVKGAKPQVLVGKGITFDSGGISIKPSAAMDEMKFDMCGAASVFGTLKAAMQMQLKLNLVGVVPTSENLPDGNAVKPADIVKTLSGQTVEILNTDAEGRLILCDALTYAQRFKPAAIVDMATLTGACVVALGHVVSGLFGNDESLVKELWNAGEKADDRAWQLPLYEDYQEGLKSNFADFANVAGREGGAITAACYLSRFTKGMRWAHLDIAGTAWKSGADKGATGRPVPLLVQYLLDRA